MSYNPLLPTNDNEDYDNEIDQLRDEVDLEILKRGIPNTVEYNPFYVQNPNIKAPVNLLNRPARKQAKNKPLDYTQNVSGEYNIWYGKYLGFDYNKEAPRTERQMLDVGRDTGFTQASSDSAICIYFARGECPKGEKCTYKHNVPTEDEELKLSLLKDVFGRERHRTDREDMGGVGNFSRNNRTLYVGGLNLRDRDAVKVENILRRYFHPFGEIEYVRVIPTKSIGFVRYRLRATAEFAKEAMNDVKVETDGEPISVKWAHEDPNRVARAYEKRALQSLAQIALKRHITEMTEEEKRNFEQMQELSNHQYPNTNTQFQSPQQLQQNNNVQGEWDKLSDEEKSKAYQEYYSNYYTQMYSQMHIQQQQQQLPPQQQIPPQQLPPSNFNNNNNNIQIIENNTNNNTNINNNIENNNNKTEQEKLFVKNPFTKTEHQLEDVPNPFSNETHPYSYKDFGWNRPQKKKRDPFGPGSKKPNEKEDDKSEPNAPKRWKFDPNDNYGPSMHKKGGNKKEFAENDKPLDF